MQIDLIFGIIGVISLIIYIIIANNYYYKEVKNLEIKTSILWRERQNQRCKDKIHDHHDWQTIPGYYSTDAPQIICKHCRKSLKDLGLN